MKLGTRDRTAILVSGNLAYRTKLAVAFTGMRWKVREAGGGAEALFLLEEQVPETLIVDSWLPDLDSETFVEHVLQQAPHLDLLTVDGEPVPGCAFRSVRRHEILQAIREASRGEGPEQLSETGPGTSSAQAGCKPPVAHEMPQPIPALPSGTLAAPIPSLIGQSAPMRELTRLIRLVAPHDAAVLIEGETGTGKELVAKAVHDLSSRSAKSLIVLNCAAIPEALLEAELFGHTRGAFTGAAQARVGRIEAAGGGTLFLDEIGEMPLGLQAKLLRFLENGELQRIGENQPTRVDVRVVAATHRQLEEQVISGGFRLDLFHRLSVFPLEVPSLRERREDIPLLAAHFLSMHAGKWPAKHLTREALERLLAHDWMGNVRELCHVLHRAVILAEARSEIRGDDIRMRRSTRL